MNCVRIRRKKSLLVFTNMTQEYDQWCVDMWRKRKREFHEVKDQAIFRYLFYAGIRKRWKLSLSLQDPDVERSKTNDNTVITEWKTISSLMSHFSACKVRNNDTDKFEKSTWKECSEQNNCCSINYSNMPELYSILTIHFGCYLIPIISCLALFTIIHSRLCNMKIKPKVHTVNQLHENKEKNKELANVSKLANRFP